MEDILAHRVTKFEDIDTTTFCYYKLEGIWYLYIPGCGLANLGNHQIIEHEDGTISVSPSILTTGHDSGKPVTRHGYLERGIWRDC